MTVARWGLLMLVASLSGLSCAYAEVPVLSGAQVHCTRSAMLMHCTYGQEGYYAFEQRGNNLWLRGHDAATGLSWAQTNTRFGRVQFFTGQSSDGNVWVGLSRQIGWTSVSRFSTSSGDRGRVSCNRLTGCD